MRWLLDHGPSDLAIGLYPRLLHPGLMAGAHHVPCPLSVLLGPIALLHHLLLLAVNHLSELIGRCGIRCLTVVCRMWAKCHLFLAWGRRAGLIACQTLNLRLVVNHLPYLVKHVRLDQTCLKRGTSRILPRIAHLQSLQTAIIAE